MVVSLACSECNGLWLTLCKSFLRFLGGVDLLLHLLTNLKDLPVTKSHVKQSGMGKAIGSIEKHPICAGTPNQAAIMDRVQGIKSAWNASVKARKEKVSRLDSIAVCPRSVPSTLR